MGGGGGSYGEIDGRTVKCACSCVLSFLLFGKDESERMFVGVC